MKTQTMTVRLATVLLTVMLLFSSCGIIILNDGDEVGTTQAPVTDLPDPTGTYLPNEYPVREETDGFSVSCDRLNALPSADLNGISSFFAVASETGDMWNDEAGLYVSPGNRRNALVNEKYNTTVISQYYEAETLLAKVRDAYRAGDYFADFAVIPHIELGAYYKAGYLNNLKSLLHTDFSAEYYNQEAMAQMTVGGVIYAAVGDATEQLEQYACLYINKTLTAPYGVTPNYKALYDGTFTWDSLLISMKALPEEVIGYVTGYDSDTMRVMTYYSLNKAFLSPNGIGGMILVANNAATAALVETVKEILPFETSTLTLDMDSWQTEPEGDAAESVGPAMLEGFEIFSAGKSAYAFGLLGDIASLRTAGFLWEVMPYPKLSDTEEYGTPIHNNAPVIVSLSTGSNIETMGYILQALNAASFGFSRDAFYEDAFETAITGIYTLDMLDIIRENPIYDHSRMFGSTSSALREGTYRAYYHALGGDREASYYFNRYTRNLQVYLDGLVG